jgi:hypothetical protein
MPPRRSARVAAVAEQQSAALAPLPYALVLYIFSLLPVDQRLRCAEVCRGWRVVLSDASLWLRLDLSPAGGIARATEALLRAATKRAAGGLQALNLTGCVRMPLHALRAVAAENSAALVELRMALDSTIDWQAMDSADLEQLLQAAPQLLVLETDVSCEDEGAARRVLRNEAPFGPLRVRTLVLSGLGDADAVRFVSEYAAAHAWLTGMHLFRAPLNLPAALDAVVDAALQLRLTYLEFFECHLTPASAPALVRLLGGALKTLVLEGEGKLVLDEPAALLLGNALRANTTLTSVTFKFIRLFNEPASAAALLGALTGHPSLRILDVSDNRRLFNPAAPAVVAVVGAALAALVAANARPLHELHLRDCRLGDAGLGPLANALPHNTHLRMLDCTDNELSEAFERDQLLPAVRRANPWLQATLF